jgi:hypothetical protein
MSRTLIIAGIGGVIALIAGASTLGSPELTKPGTVKISTRGLPRTFVDRGPVGRGPGDLLVSRQLLYNKGITPKAIGHSDFVCTYTARYARQCMATFTLPKGKIVVAGTITFNQFYSLAVIGGTGFYDNVLGSLTVTRLSRTPPRELLVFRLTI